MEAKEKWLVQAKKADFEELGKVFKISPVTARLIRNRNHETMEAYYQYLQADISDMHNPFLMKDMETGVAIVYQGIKEGKRIRVIGDYDIDGVCSGYILTDALKRLGANVDFDVPDRIVDGYGLNQRLIEQSYNDGVELIITCDNGIAAKMQIEYAKSLGLKVVVTDHHEVPFVEEQGVRSYILPEADAIINPKQEDCQYPFKDLCGAAVALKFILAYMEYFKKQTGNNTLLSEEDLLKYYVFAAIATVGDVVNLVGENRIIVKYGLKHIKEVKNHGLQALIRVNECEEKVITGYIIGFVLGPCINAGGRLETAKLAFELFMSENYEIAYERAMELKEINEKRKSMTVAYTKKAMEQIEQDASYQTDKVLVIYLPDCHESLAGIIAGRIREAYNKPTFVLTDSAEGVKGSGRSIEEYHMFDNLVLMNTKYEYLTKYGGHSLAAGLSLTKEHVEDLRVALNEMTTLTEEQLIRKVWIDVALPFQYISKQLIEELDLLEPFGKGNEKPVFAEKIERIQRVQVRGKDRNVMTMTLVNQSGARMEAVLFSTEDEFRERLLEHYSTEEVEGLFRGYNNQIKLSVIYYPEVNVYQGVETLKIVIKRYII